VRPRRRCCAAWSSGAASRGHELAGQQPKQQAEAQQEIVAELARALDGFLAKRKPPLGLAGEVAVGAQGAEGFDDQPVVPEPAGKLHRPFPKLLCCGQAGLSCQDRGSDQRRCEQLGVRTGLWPLQDRQEQAGGFPCREPAIQ
jgi:hypothetical protein